MKIFIFFDYVWYKVYKYYLQQNDNTAFSSASITLSVGQMSNILTILYLFEYLLKIEITGKILILVLATLVLAFNTLRYNKKKVETLAIVTNYEIKKAKKKGDILVMFYLIFSLALMILIAAILGHLLKN